MFLIQPVCEYSYIGNNYDIIIGENSSIASFKFSVLVHFWSRSGPHFFFPSYRATCRQWTVYLPKEYTVVNAKVVITQYTRTRSPCVTLNNVLYITKYSSLHFKSQLQSVILQGSTYAVLVISPLDDFSLLSVPMK